MAFRRASKFLQRPNRRDIMYGSSIPSGPGRIEPKTHFRLFNALVPFDFDKSWGEAVEAELKKDECYSDQGFHLEDKMTLGKFKGIEVEEVIKINHDYIRWICSEIEWFKLDLRALKYLYMRSWGRED